MHCLHGFMEEVSTHQAKTQLSNLIVRALAAEEIIICRSHVPTVKLMPVDATAQERTRPKVGTVTSQPLRRSKRAFAALSETELQEWSL